MADYPDIYADGFAVTVGTFGITVTFQLSQPNLEPGPHIGDAGEIIARVRMGPPLAKALAQGLSEAAAQAPVVAPETKVQH